MKTPEGRPIILGEASKRLTEYVDIAFAFRHYKHSYLQGIWINPESSDIHWRCDHKLFVSTVWEGYSLIPKHVFEIYDRHNVTPTFPISFAFSKTISAIRSDGESDPLLIVTYPRGLKLAYLHGDLTGHEKLVAIKAFIDKHFAANAITPFAAL